MVDTSIAMGYKPIEVQNPMNQLAQMMQIKAAQQSGQMNAMKMDEYTRTKERQNKLLALMGQMPADANDDQRSAALKGAGYFDEADKLQTGILNRRKIESEAGAKEWETKSKKLDYMSQAFGYVKDNPTPEAAIAVNRHLGEIGVFTPEQVAQAEAAIKANPSPDYIRENATRAFQSSLSAKDQLPKLQTFNAGNRQVNQSVNPITGKAIETGSTVIGQSADNAATVANAARTAAMVDARARAGQAQLATQHADNIDIKQQALTQRQAGNNKPLPVGALKMRVEAQDAADTADGVNQRLSNVENLIKDGKLNFGPVSNLVSAGLNASGFSTENSRNLSSFRSEMEKLRNDSLRLNKGVQTDGDAQRAWNELFQNINDTKLVQQRLSEIKQINARAKNLRLMEVDTIDRNYGRSGNAPTQRSVLDEADAILNGG